MPYGKWPDRVKGFRKWSQERIDKAKITDSVTSTGGKTHPRRRRRRRRSKRRLKKEEE